MTTEEQIYYETLMRKCIDLAAIAKSRGDSPVGSMIVQNDRIISEGIEGVKTFPSPQSCARICGTKCQHTFPSPQSCASSKTNNSSSYQS